MSILYFYQNNLTILFFLGLSFSSASFGQGSIAILMDYVNCSGSEGGLWDCLHFTHSYGCTHSNDVGVRCQPGKSCDLFNTYIQTNIVIMFHSFSWDIIVIKLRL